MKLGDGCVSEPAGRPGVADPARWEIFHDEAENAKELTDPEYIAARDQGLGLIRNTLAAILADDKLDAFIYPTAPQPARPIKRDYSGPQPDSGTSLANASGFPDAIVPAGLTKDRLPVTLSFIGGAFSEPKILGYAYAFEQATHARARPSTTPPLPGEKFDY